MPTVFLSHSSSDSSFAEKLARDLENSRIGVWLGIWEILVGDSIISKISEGIRSNDFLAVILSPDSVRSPWVNKEISVALMEELEEKKITILPIMHLECEIPILLRDKKYADFKNDYNSGLQELLKAIIPEIMVERAKRITGSVIGIDFGTSNSTSAVLTDGLPRPILNKEGAKSTPSTVSITDEGEWISGMPALLEAENPSSCTFSSFKRHLGKNFTFSNNHQSFKAYEIAGHLFRKFKDDAEMFLGRPVTQAVITCPVHFTFRQKIDLLEAAKLGGFEVLRLIAEPTAAILAYEIYEPQKESIVAVYDMGGGSFDISIAEMGDGVIEVISIWGDTRLGGIDFDMCLINLCENQFKKIHGSTATFDFGSTQRINTEIEKSKIILSSASKARIYVPYGGVDQYGKLVHIDITINLSQFEEATLPLILRSIEGCRNALVDLNLRPGTIERLENSAKTHPSSDSIYRQIHELKSRPKDHLIEESKNQIDKIILVGLPTRMPIIRQKLRSFFGKPPICKIDPDDAVAFGAATQAGVLEGITKDTLLLDCIPFSIGIEQIDRTHYLVLHRHTTIPCRDGIRFMVHDFSERGAIIKLFEEETLSPEDDGWLATFIVPGQPGFQEPIECTITIDVDANSLMSVLVIIEEADIDLEFKINATAIHSRNENETASNLSFLERMTHRDIFSSWHGRPAERL